MTTPTTTMPAPHGVRLVLRDASGEREWPGTVSLATRGAAVVAATDPERGATLTAMPGGLRLSVDERSDVRVNARRVAGDFALRLNDVIRMTDVDLVVDRLEADLARLSIYPLTGNVTGGIDADGIVALPASHEDRDIVAARSAVTDVRKAAGGSRRLTTRVRLALGVVALLVSGLLAAFAFLQRVSLVVTPTDATVRATNALFSWHAGDTLFVFPGEHRIEARRQGYRAAATPVRVARAQAARVELRLTKLPGLVQFDTGGVAAQIGVDGAFVGRVPGELSIDAGLRTITVRAPRYLDQVLRLDVVGMGERQSVRVTMQPSFGVVAVRTNPAGARVFVDDEDRGVSPARLELASGVRRVRLEAEGMRPWQATIVVQAGAATELGPIDLGAADAKLLVRSVPDGADVTVGGVYRGQTPLTLTLAPGIEYALGVTRGGYEAAKRNVFAEPTSDTTLDVRLIAQLVTVRFVGEPADAEVLVDGAVVGRAPSDLQLTATKHRVEIRKPGYESFTANLELAPNLARTIEYKLLDPRDIVGNAPRDIKTKGGIVLRLIPGGEFRMGAERREQGRRPNEGARPVTLARPYYLGVTEITNGQFRQFRALHNSGFVGQQSLDVDTQSVTGITWSDAVEFCNWLSEQEGLSPAYVRVGTAWSLATPVGTGYRLPTEAEWEFAARFVADERTQRFAWGDVLPVKAGAGNFAGAETATLAIETLAGYRDDFQVVSKPAQFAPNALGLYDLAGNVSEWVNDRYSSLVPSAAAVDPLGPTEGDARGIRGSSWRTSQAAALRFAWREPANAASDSIGFRVARYVAAPIVAEKAPP
jgi:formylglycine-generating enzyme required for sulfatase activity